MTRMVDLASANQLMSYVHKTQQRLNTLQTQLSSGKTSQDYTGIARDSGRLIRLENARDLYQRFMTTNQTMDLRLKTVETTLGSVQETVKNFRAAVLEYDKRVTGDDKGATGDPERVAAVQDAAFKSLVSLQGLLNTEFDGRYLLAGSKATTRPVDFGLTTLEKFQEDSAAVPVSTTRNIDYYQGDSVAQTHRVDAERSVSFDLTAADPAFEKAIRAMKLIAQGQFGSEGGLDQNPGRIEDALALLDSALDRASPDGSEAAGNLETIQIEVGLHRALINDTNERLRGLTGALDSQIADVETINPTEVATRLFDQANALEASLTTIARVRQLSLVKFL